jgi:hypothetical protein
MKLGSLISSVATPIAGLVGADCYDPETHDLRPDSPCAKARRRLDEARTLHDFSSAIFDRFWSKNKKGDKMTEEQVEWKIDIAIKTNDIVAAQVALKKSLDELGGEILAVNPRSRVQFGGGPVARPSQTGQVISRPTTK